MKTAIIGSRDLTVKNLEKYIPESTAEIVSGGAKGIDTCAKEFSITCNLKLTEFLPEYDKYGRAAPIRRNDKIIAHSDIVIIFWDGQSKGTEYVLKMCKKLKKAYKLFIYSESSGDYSETNE